MIAGAGWLAGWAGLKSTEQAVRKGRLELSGRSWSCGPGAERLPLPGNLGSPLKDFQLIESGSAQMMKDNPLYLKSTGYEH